MRCTKCSLFLGVLAAFCSSDALAWGTITDAIYSASVSGKMNNIDYYLQRGYSVDTPDEQGVTALCRAYYKRQTAAYNLLLSYGANPYVPCMYAKDAVSSFNWKPYALGAAIVGGGAALAAFSSGGGGGGSSGGDSGGNNGDSGANGGNSSNGNDKPSPDDFTPYDVSYFQNLREYTGGYFLPFENDKGKMVYSVNYHDPINAAQAYAKFYGYDEAGKMVSKLEDTVLVGVLDTGVYREHREFLDANGNSIVTKWHNFDYGPCTEVNSSNCWRVTNSGDTKKELTLYINGSATSEVIELKNDKYAEWASGYESSYVYSEASDKPSHSSEHGSNVAGIIAGTLSGSYGSMGIAFTNTYIDAVRWDLKSSFVRPIEKLLDDEAFVVNMSLGTNSSASMNAGMNLSMLNYYLENDSNFLDAAKLTMDNYTTNSLNGTRDGMIWVLAAGNEEYSQPSIESGLKRLPEYQDMMMLVVVSVYMNSDGTYSLSDFSNKCGVASGYCLAAPGGNGSDTASSLSLLYSAANSDSYSAMAGTSQATPVVSGSIAFLKEAYSWMKASQIIELLLESANKNGVNYDESTYGAGLVDLYAAVMTYYSDTGVKGDIKTVSGENIYGEKIALNDMHLTTPSIFAQALKKALPETITAFDKYQRPFNFATSNYISATHAGHKNLKNDVANIAVPHVVQHEKRGNFDFSYTENAPKNFSWMNVSYHSGKHTTGFYLSQDTRYATVERFSRDLSNPFMAMSSAYGMHHQYDFSPMFGLKLEAVGGQNALYDGDYTFGDSSFHKQAYAVNSELQLKKNNLFSLGISSGLLHENDALLGMNGHGALGISGAQTYTTGVKMSLFMTDKWTLSGSYYQGYTQAQKFASDLMQTTRLMSDSFAIDSNYRLDKNTDFGLRLSSPLRVERGSLKVDFPSGRDSHSDMVYRNRYQASLKPESREYKFALYLNKIVSEKFSWRSEFDVRIHPEHQNTSNDYRALFGLSYAFN